MNVFDDGHVEMFEPKGINIGDKCWAGHFIQVENPAGTVITPTTLGRLDGFYDNGKAKVWFGDKIGHVEVDVFRLKRYDSLR